MEIVLSPAKIDKLQLRRKRAVLLQAFDRSKIPSRVDDRDIQTSTHGALVLKLPDVGRGIVQRTVDYMCAKQWNELPTLVRINTCN